MATTNFLEQLPITTPAQRLAKDNCIAIFLVGSHLYGTARPSSDRDYEGIFIEPPEYVIGSKSIEEVDFSTKSTSKCSARNTPKDIDIKLYSLRNFFYLAQKNNPNKVEHFFIPERNIVYRNEHYWQQIKEAKELFLSLKIKHSFSGYAHSQKQKLLTKKKRLDELREFKVMLESGIAQTADTIRRSPTRLGTVMDRIGQQQFKFITRTVTLEGTPAIIVDDKEYNFGMEADAVLQQVTKRISQYGSRTKDLDDGGYDFKFASHLFRLYYEGLKLLKEGSITFPLEENKFLLAVKNGEYDLDYILKRADEFEPLLEIAYQESKLPHSPDQDGISKLQTAMYLEYWREKEWL
jgi:hypothetical protein